MAKKSMPITKAPRTVSLSEVQSGMLQRILAQKNDAEKQMKDWQAIICDVHNIPVDSNVEISKDFKTLTVVS